MNEKPRDPELDPDPNAEEDEGKSDEQAGKDQVQEQSEESFPASDPPSY